MNTREAVTFKYQYDFYRQHVDYFDSLPQPGEAAQPNCFLLVSEIPFTKKQLQTLFERVNGGEDVPSYVIRCGATY